MKRPGGLGPPVVSLHTKSVSLPHDARRLGVTQQEGGLHEVNKYKIRQEVIIGANCDCES